MSRRLWLIAGLAWCLALVFGAKGCAVSTPFEGPGYERGRGVIHPRAGERVFVALTHATLDVERRGPFDAQVQEVLRRMPEHPGLIAAAGRKQLFGDEVWTVSAWTDEASLEAFVRSPLHLEAMRAGAPAILGFDQRVLELPKGALPLSWGQVEAAFAEPARD